MASDKNHYDVIVIGSGFGGSVAALRAAEKGYKVGVLESGKRWPDEDVPTTSWDVRKFAWQPEAEMYGIQRMEFLDDVLVLCGAGVGGGSHVYGNTLYVPPKKFFDAAEWSRITDWADEMAPYIDQATRMLGVVRVPYMDTMVDRLMRDVAADMGNAKSFNKAPVGVYFGTPGVEADDPYFGGVGPKRRGCISCGNCMIGCGHNAKNKLNVNYLYLAEKLGAEVHELSEVHELEPLARGRLRGAGPPPRLDAAHGAPAPSHVHGRPGDRLRARLRLGEAAASYETRQACFRSCPISWARARARTPSSCCRSAGASATGSAIRRRSTSRRDRSRSPRGVAGRPDQHRAGRLRREQRLHGVCAHLSPPARRGTRRGLAEARWSSTRRRCWTSWTRATGRSARRCCCACRPPTLRSSLLEGRHVAQPARQRTPAVHAHPGRRRLRQPARAREHAEQSGPVFRGRQPHRVRALHRRHVDRASAPTGRGRSLSARVRYPGLHVIDGSVMPANPGVNPSLMILAGRAGDVVLAEQGRRRSAASLGRATSASRRCCRAHRVPAHAPGALRLRTREGRHHPALSR